MFQASALKSPLSVEDSISIYVWNPRKRNCKFLIHFGARPASVEIILRESVWKKMVANLKRSVWSTKAVRNEIRTPVVLLSTGKVDWMVCDLKGARKRSIKSLATNYGRIACGAMTLEINKDFYDKFRSLCIKASELYASTTHAKGYFPEKRIEDQDHVQLVFAGKPYLWDQGISTLISTSFSTQLIKK